MRLAIFGIYRNHAKMTPHNLEHFAERRCSTKYIFNSSPNGSKLITRHAIFHIAVLLYVANVLDIGLEQMRETNPQLIDIRMHAVVSATARAEVFRKCQMLIPDERASFRGTVLLFINVHRTRPRLPNIVRGER